MVVRDTINELEHPSEDDRFTVTEQARLSSFVNGLTSTMLITRRAIETLQAISDDGSPSAYTWADSVVCAFEDLYDAIIDISPSFYPPQEDDELCSQAQTLANATTQVLEVLELHDNGRIENPFRRLIDSLAP